MNECIIGVGSNIEPEKNIVKMIELLQKKIKVIKISSWVHTTPIGIKDQPKFINGAVKIKTSKTQSEVKSFLKFIEDTMLRDRTVSKFGPRVIDLDIVAWNGEIVDKDYYSRDFLRKSVDEVR